MVQGQDFSNKPLAVAYMQDVRGIDSAQSWSVSVLPFLRNTEFFHYQQPGRTTMGAMSRLLWQQGDALRMEVGLLVHHVFGGDSHVLPHLAAVQQIGEKGDWSWRFGTLNNPGHGLVEPLYNPDLWLRRPAEYGLQLQGNNMDLWWSWDRAIEKESPFKEAFTMGMVTNPSFEVIPNVAVGPSVQIQFHHVGGQIDNAPPQPTGNRFDGAIGLHLMHEGSVQSRIEWLQLFYADPDQRFSQVSQGKGQWLSLSQKKPLNAGSHLRWGLAHWQGQKFLSVNGQGIYQYMDLISLPVMHENQWLKCSFRWEKALTDDAMHGQLSFGVDQYLDLFSKQWSPVMSLAYGLSL